MSGERYDSRPDTLAHIGLVGTLLGRVVRDLETRACVHDASKLKSPELEAFDEFTPKLKGSTYGSDEYRAFLAAMKPALDHHYAANSHHPEHYRWHCPACGGSFSGPQAPLREWGDGTVHRWCPRCCAHGGVIWEAELMDKPERGVRGMSLLDLVEMLCDWIAATKRHADGDIRRSIEINQQRFGYSDEVKAILLNTLPALGLVP